MNVGQEFDAIQASRAMKKRWGIDLDWHEFSYTLSSMTASGEAEFLNFHRGGHGIYRIKESV